MSADGTKESELNLSIGLKLRSIAELLGLKTQMTRSDESARQDYASYSVMEKLLIYFYLCYNYTYLQLEQIILLI